MPQYEFVCKNTECKNKDKTVLLSFHMTENKNGCCSECGEPLSRVFGNFVDQYKGSDFTRSADAREAVDVWK